MESTATTSVVGKRVLETARAEPKPTRKELLKKEALGVACKFGVPLVELPAAMKEKTGPGMANSFECYCTANKDSAARKVSTDPEAH